MKDDDIKQRCGQYCNWLMNEENPRVEIEERDVNQGIVRNVSDKETEKTFRWKPSGKTVEAD